MWLAQAPVPSFTVSAHVGMVEGLAIVKRRRSEGSIAKSLSIEIVRVVFVLFSDNARAFLQECQRAWASSSWAIFVRGPRLSYGPPRAHGAAWAALGQNQFSFFVENRNRFSF